VRALTRAGSDHTPLINSGVSAHLGNKNHFYFELSWMRQEHFYEMIKINGTLFDREALMLKDGKIK
jgi:hypothetical protein